MGQRPVGASKGSVSLRPQILRFLLPRRVRSLLQPRSGAARGRRGATGRKREGDGLLRGQWCCYPGGASSTRARLSGWVQESTPCWTPALALLAVAACGEAAAPELLVDVTYRS